MIVDNSHSEGTPVNPVAEAVRGLARDRSVLVQEWRNTSRSWYGYRTFAEEQAAKIAEIDKRIDVLLSARKEGQP